MEKQIINKFVETPYGFTFTIPANKKVYYDGRRRKFSQMALSSQSIFINQLMTKIIWQEHFSFIDWVFERHEPSKDDKLGRLHIHGYALVKKEYDHLCPLNLLANSFYTHNGIIGIASSIYPRLCNIQRTYSDLNYWYEYINKKQGEINYHSPYNSQKFLINSIDPPLVSISQGRVEVEF